MSKGYIYILINPAYPYLLKIGMSENVDERIKQLSKNTSTPSDFQLVFSEYVDNCNLIEKWIHQKLEGYRNNFNREFFNCPIKIALETTIQVIEIYNKQGKINLHDNSIDKFTWWKSLDQVWQQTLKENIDELDFEPKDEELIETVGKIIYDTKNLELRSKVLDLLKKETFRKKIRNWYERLSNKERKIFKTYVNYDFNENNYKELDKIINLTRVDCFAHIQITDLSPLIKLEKLEELYCNSCTNIKNIEPLERLKNLKILNLNHTNITSLEVLKKLTSLEKIYCLNTSFINEIEIEDLRKFLPNCFISKDIS